MEADADSLDPQWSEMIHPIYQERQSGIDARHVKIGSPSHPAILLNLKRVMTMIHLDLDLFAYTSHLCMLHILQPSINLHYITHNSSISYYTI